MGPLPKRLLPFLWYFIKQQKYYFLFMMVCHLGWALDWTVMPFIFKEFIDRVISISGDRGKAWSMLAFPVACGAALWVTMEILYRSYDFLSSRVYPRFEAAIRMAMLEYIRQHSYRYFADHLAGDIASKIEDMPESATRILQLTLTLFFPSFAAIIIATSIFSSLHPLFGIIVASWFTAHISVCLFFARKCNQLSDIHSESKSTINGKVVDSFSNMPTVKSFARSLWEWKYINRYQQQEQQDHQYVLRLIFKIRVILGLMCFSVMGALMMWLMVGQWQKGIITPGELSYIFYSGWGICVMAWISGIELPNFFKEMGTCRQALRPLEVSHEITDIPGAIPLHISKGEITFEKVTFCYQQKNNIFADKNVTIAAGSKVGLVGFSGSGKTTFVHLMLRFYDVHEGRILIDRQDISKVTQESLHNAIAMIPQDTSLFHRSLMENIRYGRLDASDEEVVEASKRAHCHEFISQLHQGYDLLVGERGIKLSGGQRQRIAIARAILKNAPVLILDEATSALDSITEKLIQEGLQDLMEGRTTIVVAHRLSTLSKMDRILVFDKGHIIEDGAHQALLKKEGGHYARMWHMQAGGFMPEKEEL